MVAILISHSLFFYVKKAHIRMIVSNKKFLREFSSEKPEANGYLSDKDIIPLPLTERNYYPNKGVTNEHV
ncbi:MAG: hypothetical protein H0V39_02950 [Nitrosomonas sp.]|nr:hypothetical protein [Nitrosomonas sp.]